MASFKNSTSDVCFCIKNVDYVDCRSKVQQNGSWINNLIATSYNYNIVFFDNGLNLWSVNYGYSFKKLDVDIHVANDAIIVNNEHYTDAKEDEEEGENDETTR